MEINKKIALFGVSKAEIEDAETRKKVNHIILIAKLAISKYKYGKCKNLTLILEVELKMRSHKISNPAKYFLHGSIQSNNG